MKNIIVDLNNPSSKYRALPFWSWNDKLEIDKIRFQIGEMKKAGMGGYFMHARGGLETEYLGKDWMAAIDAGLDEAEKKGMSAWVYDENGWPSGFAGGKVCDLGDRFHGRWLEKEIKSITDKDLLFFEGDKSSILGIYNLSSNFKSFSKLDKITAQKAIQEGTPCLVITHSSNPYYIDVLSKEVVGKFIEYTHEAYKSKFPDKFDGRFKGFFTDEPRLSGRNIDEDLPWSYQLPECFESDYSLNLLDNLPSLFFPCGNFYEIRYKFWKLVNTLFVNSYIKQLGEWCRNNNCKLTGHIMMEESMSTQMPNTGGVMPFYEYMDIPGIDWLRRTMSSPVVPKQVSSVAAQTGKKQVITESFALCGWNAGFEDLKWVAQWQYVNGVNLLCQHLQGYTIRGLRKRDYPPSLFIQQPWWDQYQLFTTYFARLGMILSEGFNPVDVLVIHPIRSGWLLFNGEQNSQLKQLDQKFLLLLENLSEQHIEYHLGDETIIERYGSVSSNILSIGLCKYKTIVIPETLTLATSTLNLIETFVNNGGNVIAVKSFPPLEEGQPNKRSVIMHDHIKIYDMNTVRLVDFGLKKLISLIDITTGLEATDLQATSRVFESNTFWYIVNNSRVKNVTITAMIPDERELYLYDPVKNSYELLESVLENGIRKTKLLFEPTRSMILQSGLVSKEFIKNNIFKKEEVIDTANKWNLHLEDPNILLLDRCRYSIDDGEWQKELDVIHLFKLLLERKKACQLAMEFIFDSHIDQNDFTNLNLIIEQGEEFSISVNGQPVNCEGREWWKDSSFKKVGILDKLVKGRNTIVLKRQFYQSEEVYRILFGKNIYETEKNKLTFDVELENIYLTGDFAVKSATPFTEGGNSSLVTEGPFYLTSLTDQVDESDLTENGLLFFAGKVCLTQEINITKKDDTRYVLEFNKPNVAMIKVLVNNTEVTNLLWAPWKADLTEYLKSGKNQISLILYGGNRNMLGPHHHVDGEPFNVGPGSFTGKWSWVEKKSEAIPATAAEKQKNYWDKRYALVPFGLGKK